MRARLAFWVLPLAIAVVPRAALLTRAVHEEAFGKYTWAAAEIVAGRALGGRLLDFSPLYLALHVAARRVAADPAALFIVAQLVLGVAATMLLYGTGRALGGRAVGVLAAALYSGYASLLAYEATLEPEAIVLFVVALLLRLAAAAPSRWVALGMGLALGAGVATRPNLVLAAPLLLVPLLAPDRASASGRGIARGARLGTFALGLAAGALPLIASLGSRGGSFLEAMSGGQVFHQGMNPEAQGMGVAYPSLFYEMPASFAQGGDYAHEMYREIAAADLGRPVTGREADALWRARALRFASLYPGAALRLEIRKALLFFSGVEPHDVPEAVSLAEKARGLAPIPFGALAALGLAGAILGLRRPRRSAMPILFLALYLASALVLFVSSRQRLPASGPLALLAADAVVVFVVAARGRRPAALALPAVTAACALMPLAVAPVIRGYRSQFEAMRRAEALVADARAAYDRARMADYRAAVREAAIFRPDLLSTLPGLDPARADTSAPRADMSPAHADSQIAAVCISAGPAERAFLAGDFLLAVGDAEKAAARLDGLERHPWYGAQAANLRALALSRIGREDGALDALARCDPPSLAGGALRAVLLARAGRGADAASLGERLRACHGETAVVYFRGRALFEIGAWRDAREAFIEVRDRLPAFSRARLYLAACHVHLGDDAAAAAEHAAALDSDPDATIAALRISPVLERLAAASPDDRGIRSRLGAVLLAEGDPAGAARVLVPLLAEQPSDDAVRLRLARALVEQGKMAEARAIAAPLGGGR